jgi:MFS family permease
MSKEESDGGWSHLLSGRLLAPLIAVCLGVWLHAADGLMVATLIPDIVADIGGARFIAWSMALYEIGSIAAGAASAVLALRYGLRLAMTASALLYLAGCALSAVAPDIAVLLAGRLAQGTGGGGLVALSFVAISMLFDRASMPRVVAAVSALWGVSSFIGPLVGGLFAAWDFWRGGFWFFGAQAGLLAAWIWFGRALEGGAPPQPDAGRIPAARLGVLALGVVLIAASGIEISRLWTPLLLASGLTLLALFFRLDSRAGDDRLLPRGAIDPRGPIGTGMLMLMLFSAGTIVISIYGPLMMIALHHVSALTAGYIIAASSIGWSTTAFIVAGSSERRDPLMILGGMVLVTLGVVGYVVAVPNGPLWLIVVCAALEGGGFGIAWTFVLRRLTALAPPQDSERIASALPTLQRIGYAVGAALMGLVANAAGVSEAMSYDTAHNAAFWIFAASVPLALAGLTAAVAFSMGAAPSPRLSLPPQDSRPIASP